MIFSRKRFTFSAIFLCIFITFGAYGEETLDSVFFRDFDDDSYFVTVPTYAGNYLGLIIGAIPAAAVAGGFQYANAAPATVVESGRVTLAIFVKPIGLLFGLPFKFTKAILWDSPKYVFGGILGDTDPPEEIPEGSKSQ